MSEAGMECPFCRQPLTTGYIHEVVATRPPRWALDAVDGAALRKLRDALAPGGWLSIIYAPGPNGWRWEVKAHADDITAPRPEPGMSQGDTIAKAADACREALG